MRDADSLIKDRAFYQLLEISFSLVYNFLYGADFFLFIRASLPFVIAALTGHLMKTWIWKSASHLSSIGKLIKQQENSFLN